MYPAVRRFDGKTIGRWRLPVGRPTSTSQEKWVQQCNFVFKVRYLVSTDEDGGLLADRGTGWIIEIQTQDGRRFECFVTCEQATSNSSLRRRIMSCERGLICRLTSDDFLHFVDEDLQHGVKELRIMRHCGKVVLHNKVCWMFPDVCMSSSGEVICNLPAFLTLEFLRRRENGDLLVLPSKLPQPLAPLPSAQARAHLTQLSHRLRDYFGPRLPHVLHLFCSLFKAIYFDKLLREEHFVSVANISGPPNIGKTFACAILLSMMGASEMMLSRCTPSAMIDAAHVCKNCLIVWDDPRDCTFAQLSSIVHEAFHGHSTSTISRGIRRYASSLIVGTQDPLLGMPCSCVNVATFTRLTHIDMKVQDDFTPTTHAEEALQVMMPQNGHLFAYLLEQMPTYTKKDVDTVYKRIVTPDVIGRAVRIAAIDRHMCTMWQRLGFDIGDDEVDRYFSEHYMPFLSKHCSRVTPLEQFIAHMKTLLADGVTFAPSCFKERVVVDLKQHGPTDCFAIYPRDFFVHLQRLLPITYSKEQLHAQLKLSPKFGEVSRNVAYKCENGTSLIRRSIVIRRAFLLGQDA